MIQLATIEAAVLGEAGKVFSTNPEVAIGEDGKVYYIKGRNSGTAFAEVAGCRLSQLLGLRTPTAQLAMFDGGIYAAVESVPHADRNIQPWLRDIGRIVNAAHLFEVIAVDTWLVNPDRNMGNLVGSGTGDGRVEVYMIDFEKSAALGPNPFVTSGTIDWRQLWPTAELGQFLRRSRPGRCPAGMVERIRTLPPETIRETIQDVAEETPFVTWHESSIELLVRRAQDIARLVDTVWATN